MRSANVSKTRTYVYLEEKSQYGLAFGMPNNIRSTTNRMASQKCKLRQSKEHSYFKRTRFFCFDAQHYAQHN